MAISDEAKAAIEEEEQVLKGVLHSLEEQLKSGRIRLETESARAREFTERIVAAQRDVDKQMLASDEAVSHGLTKLKRTELKGVLKLLDRPYFARIVLEERGPGDKPRQIEYKIGTVSNVDCRIIDWKKAPLSKLYYELKEGEEYAEVIQGREREGKVLVRNRVEIEAGQLKRISCRYGDFEKRDGEWTQLSAGARSGGSSPQGFPDVLALITAEQFRAITEDAECAVLIQGIAGSGKTTVALHRLAWLLKREESELRSEECIILVRSNPLKRFIELSLDALEIGSVEVRTFQEWSQPTVENLGVEIVPDNSHLPLSTTRAKRSLALLKAIDEAVQENSEQLTEGRYGAELLRVLSRPERILRFDETGLLDRELLKEVYENTRDRFRNVQCTADDTIALARLFQLRNGHLLRRTGQGTFVPRSSCKHIVVDEVQDFSPLELALIISSVERTDQLTLVGDVAQEIVPGRTFPGWDKLREHWNLGSDLSRFISLAVSHRSTLPIMRFADHLLGSRRTQSGREGRPPIWFRCLAEEIGVTEAIQWLNRISERYPDALTAVLCRTLAEARFVTSLLQPTFGSAVRMGDESDFSFDAGIIVSDIMQVKGLEFANVLLWNPSEKNYGDDELARNLLYTAATRAQDHLALVSWGRHSPHLPPKRLGLVRVIQEYVEEEDPDR